MFIAKALEYLLFRKPGEHFRIEARDIKEDQATEEREEKLSRILVVGPLVCIKTQLWVFRSKLSRYT